MARVGGKTRRPRRLTIGVTLLAAMLLGAAPITGASAGEDGSWLRVELGDYVFVDGFTGDVTMSFEKGGTKVCPDWVMPFQQGTAPCDIVKGMRVTATDGVRTAEVIAESLFVIKSNSVTDKVVTKIVTPRKYEFGCGGDAMVYITNVMRYVDKGKTKLDFSVPGPCPGPEDDGILDIKPTSVVEEHEIGVFLADADGDETFHPKGIEPGRPTAPRKVKVPEASIKHNRFKLKWNAPNRDGDVPIGLYEIHYKVPGEDWTVGDTEGDQYEVLIENLMPNTKYLVKVRAIGSMFNRLGKFSDPIAVTTDPKP